MHLAGQGETSPRRRESGYAMVALIMAITVMAIAMTVAMPVWKHAAQREKEEELVFRGQQYAHAIGMFQRRTANAYPPSLDVLVQQKFLRKKYKDPITNDDFVPIPQGQAQTPPGAQAGQQGRGQPPGAATPGTPAPGAATGGIIGVTSKSKDESIRLYNGRSHYNEWAFVYTAPAQAPGTAAPGAGGGRGAAQPGGRGFPPGQPRTATLPDGRTVTIDPATGRPTFQLRSGNPGQGQGQGPGRGR